MRIRIYGSAPPLDERDVERLEETLGGRLPLDYRAFLLRHNGGAPDPAGFTYLAERRTGFVDQFLGVTDDEYNNLAMYFDVYRSRVPEGLVPIAHDVAGNLILLSVRASDAGRVYFWNCQGPDEDDQAEGDDALRPIADSFSAFVMGLKR